MIKPLLFIPCPKQVPDLVRDAGDRPLFNHRSPQMIELLARLEKGCQPLFGTTGDVLFQASSGTGAMESAVANLTSPGDEVIVVVSGTFSLRWADIANAYGLTTHVVDVDWRRGASAGDLASALNLWPNAQVVFHTWSESSTGDLGIRPQIGKLIRSQGRIFVVDAISGLAVSPMSMDAWNIDAAVVGSQERINVAARLGRVAAG